MQPRCAQDKREYDSNNWFEVLDNPLSTVGVYPYSEASVIKSGDRNKQVNVFRPPEELSDPETVKSFRLMPWTDDHPSTLLGDDSQDLVPAEQKGVHGVIGEQTYYRDGTLYGNIKVFSEQLARKIAAGKRELSCGYRCDFVPQEGTYEGMPYQYVQKNLRGNHVASVDAGRMGSAVRVLDAAERFTFSLDMRDDAPKKRYAVDEAEVIAITRKVFAKMALDQMVPAIRREEAARAELYRRISPIIGAFDHVEMSHAEIASYGLEKLGAPKSADPVTALNFYLAGRNLVGSPWRLAQDGTSSGAQSFIDKYLNS